VLPGRVLWQRLSSHTCVAVVFCVCVCLARVDLEDEGEDALPNASHEAGLRVLQRGG
jgi:hypothetical protein